MKTVGAASLKGIVLICLFLLVVGCNPDEGPVGRMPPTLGMDKPAPDFAFESLIGEKSTKSLSELKGKVVYLDFWASWCKPCLVSMPILDKLRVELQSEGFEVIAINLDVKPEKGIEFIGKHPVSYPVVRVPDGVIEELYQVYGLPTSYLIDRQGVLRYVHQGFKEQDVESIKQQIQMLLKSK